MEQTASSASPLVIGGGLAGSEAAWQLLQAGLPVTLHEARPAVRSRAHHTQLLGELVCSNSLRSDAASTASGLLKEELRRAGSLILDAADATRVPAGSALAVDRIAFSWRITAALLSQPRLSLRRQAATQLGGRPTIVSSGPLTSPQLAGELQRLLAGGLYFYDAIAPIVDAESLDWQAVFFGARREPDSRDYVNCPLNREQYQRLVAALREAVRVAPRSFEQEHYFEGCLPIEVMAARGDDVLAHGPFRPVGLIDPRSGRRPYAVVQLRAENQSGSCYNIVGCQTRLTQSEQRRVLRHIPGLEQARFLRYGSIHRNSYLDAPRHLGSQLQLKALPSSRVAGQLTGVEGYLESTAMGLLAGAFLAAELKGRPLPPPPGTTALGALLSHVTRPRAMGEAFQPSNITFGLLPVAPERLRDKRQRRLAVRARALAELEPWLEQLDQLRQARS